MKTYILAAGAGAAMILAACNPSPEANNPAVATDEAVAERVAEAPAAGANSFTEEQARERIVGAGYTDVTALTQGPEGVWRGQAMQGGQSFAVTLDYQGNVTSEPAAVTPGAGTPGAATPGAATPGATPN